MASRYYKLGLWLSLMLALTACAAMPQFLGQDSFAKYAESVFRHQNAVTSRMMMLTELDEKPDIAIENAEQQMNAACQSLNEYAELENSGESTGLALKMQVQNQIKSCDEKVQYLEVLLNQAGKTNN